MSGGPLADVPPGVVTVTSTTPASSAGEVAMQAVAREQLAEVPADDPKDTVAVPMMNPVPEMVTTVEPAGGPEVGVMAVTTGRAS